MAATFIAARVRTQPLLPRSLRGAKELDYVLKQAKQTLLRKIRSKIMQQPFSKRAKAALSKSLKIEVKPSTLVVTANHPAFKYFVEGRRRRQMRWLQKTPSPIPIITDEGKLIFRYATARSMKAAGGGPNVGKPGWIHPGRKPSDFVTRAKEEAREFLKAKFREALRKNSSFGKR